MTKRLLSIAAIAALMLTSGQAKEACDKSFYAPKWDHQAPTVDAYNFARADERLLKQAIYFRAIDTW